MTDIRVGSYQAPALVLTLLVILATGGLSLVFALAWTLRRAAVVAYDCNENVDAYVVPGKRLEQGRPDAEFVVRLTHCLRLWQERPRPVYLLGGSLAPGETTEAEAAADWLMQRGVPRSAIQLEQRSRHSLENLLFAKEMIGTERCLGLISNRYHLPRLGLMAEGEGLDVYPLAAEPTLDLHPRGYLRWLLEAFYSHWYLVARRVTG